MNSSSLITKAQAIMTKASGKTLTLDERQKSAIELAALMLHEAQDRQTPSEKKIQAELARMMADENGKAFTTTMTDQCFRSHSSARIADQLVYILDKFGIPNYLSREKQIALWGFKWLGKPLATVLVPLTKQMIRKETSTVILPGEPQELAAHMQRRQQEGVRINLNHLGEAILGENEANHRLQIYLDDLKNPAVEYVSIKISTIYSQINLLAWDNTLKILSERLKKMYRVAKENFYLKPDGKSVSKFVNLDMEEYRDLQITVDLFQQVLEEPEFFNFSAGIVLQSYLPDSYPIQQQLTEWAMARVAKGGAPIKIRIVKGANLAMEQVEAALKEWPQAPYDQKVDVDANYKRMVSYGCQPEHAVAAHLGIASHNLFDIAYALLLRAENKVEESVSFEMLEGMADHMRRVVQSLAGDMLLYCPAATKEEFQNAVAYLVRRLDENTAPENFLRQVFGLVPGSQEWQTQADIFVNACQKSKTVKNASRRHQNRSKEVAKLSFNSSFRNEPDTDWSLPQNRAWATLIIEKWSKKTLDPIPLVIGGEQIYIDSSAATGEDPSFPGKELYRYALADSTHLDSLLQSAEKAKVKFSEMPIEERSKLLLEIAHGLRCARADLIGGMMADTGKTMIEADVEISEAIDFAEYYARAIQEISSLEGIEWHAKGIVLVAPPWNFPCSIAAGGVLAALAAGNVVIFKPASEAVLVGWQLAQIFWKAGVSKDVLQFIACEDEPIGSLLVKDARINAVILTGATSTAKLFLRMRPGLDLMAETGGKNAMIISGLSDRDLAVKDLVASAFGHAGQKCSACSLAICEAEVYDDPNFREQLRDAAGSLSVCSPWNLAAKVNPLIHAPNPTLLKGLTLLEEGEEWLLEPRQDVKNLNLWSPGIKLGIKSSSFTYQNELFGPVLALMRAENLSEAIELANGTPYGLTSGLHSLDEREQKYWIDHIEAGNCYINRGITGAVVQRQPFGGCKESSFGPGAKAGGPNYLLQLMVPKQLALPKTVAIEISDSVKALQKQIQKGEYSVKEIEIWNASISSYQYFWDSYFSKCHDPSQVLGQDNFLCYRPHSKLTFRIQPSDHHVDIYRIMAGALICGAPLEVSGETSQIEKLFSASNFENSASISIVKESEAALIQRIEAGKLKRLRLLSVPSQDLQIALAYAACNVNITPVLANGRVELLHFLREVSTSIDYHRYGNLGVREGEKRAPLEKPDWE